MVSPYHGGDSESGDARDGGFGVTCSLGVFSGVGLIKGTGITYFGCLMLAGFDCRGGGWWMGLSGGDGYCDGAVTFTLTGSVAIRRELSSIITRIEMIEMVVNPMIRMTLNRVKRRYVRPFIVSKKNNSGLLLG